VPTASAAAPPDPQPPEETLAETELAAMIRTLQRLRHREALVVDACRDAIAHFCDGPRGLSGPADHNACRRWRARLDEALEDLAVAERLLHGVGAPPEPPSAQGPRARTLRPREACYTHLEDLDRLLTDHGYAPISQDWHALERHLGATLRLAQACAPVPPAVPAPPPAPAPLPAREDPA
jgi:hypothetical protein